jgi:hypothetical protein
MPLAKSAGLACRERAEARNHLGLEIGGLNAKAVLRLVLEPVVAKHDNL